MKKFQITMFSAIVLVIVLVAIYGTVTGNQDPLFDPGIRTTFYAETEMGKEPDIKAEKYFSEDEYDLSKFTFDLSACSWEEEGIFEIPVLYDGKKTNCVVALTVTGPDETVPETRAGMSGDTAISE